MLLVLRDLLTLEEVDMVVDMIVEQKRKIENNESKKEKLRIMRAKKEKLRIMRAKKKKN